MRSNLANQFLNNSQIYMAHTGSKPVSHIKNKETGSI